MDHWIGITAINGDQSAGGIISFREWELESVVSTDGGVWAFGSSSFEEMKMEREQEKQQRDGIHVTQIQTTCVLSSHLIFLDLAITIRLF